MIGQTALDGISKVAFGRLSHETVREEGGGKRGHFKVENLDLIIVEPLSNGTASQKKLYLPCTFTTGLSDANVLACWHFLILAFLKSTSSKPN